MTGYNYQQIIDELKSLYAQARSVKAQAKIAQRVVNSADSVKTRKSNELSSLENKVVAVDALLATSLSNSLSQLDGIKQGAYGMDLAQVKAKLDILANWKSELDNLHSADAALYPAASITQEPTINLLSNMVQTIIYSIENTFSDVYSGSKYSNVKGEGEPSIANGSSNYDVIQRMNIYVSAFENMHGALNSTIDGYVTRQINASADERASADNLNMLSRQLDTKKSDLAQALYSGLPQSEIDQKQGELDYHRTRMISEAKAAKKAHADNKAEIEAKYILISKAHESLLRAEDDLRSYYNTNSDFLLHEFGKIDEMISSDIMQAFQPIFNLLSSISGNPYLGLPGDFTSIFNQVKSAKYTIADQAGEKEKAIKITDLAPFQIVADSHGRQDVKWTDGLNSNDRIAHANRYDAYKSVLNSVAEATATKEAGMYSFYQYNYAIMDAFSSTQNDLETFFAVSNDAMGEEHNYRMLSLGVYGTTPEEVSAWSNAQSELYVALATWETATKREMLWDMQVNRWDAMFPGLPSSYMSAKAALASALVAYDDYSATPDCDQAQVDILYTAFQAAQTALSQMRIQYTGPIENYTNTDLFGIIDMYEGFASDTYAANSVLNEKRDIRDALTATLQWVDSSDADKKAAVEYELIWHNSNRKKTFYNDRIQNSISLIGFCVGGMTSLMAQLSSWDANIDAAWEQAKTAFAGSGIAGPKTAAKKADLMIPLKTNKLENLANDLTSLTGNPALFAGFAATPYGANTFNPSTFITNFSQYAEQYLRKGSIDNIADALIDEANNG